MVLIENIEGTRPNLKSKLYSLQLVKDSQKKKWMALRVRIKFSVALGSFVNILETVMGT